MRKLFLFISFVFFQNVFLFAQEKGTEVSQSMMQSGSPGGSGIEMADGLRQSGKIYVVVVVLLIIFAGIVSYLVYLDRKIKSMENKIEKK